MQRRDNKIVDIEARIYAPEDELFPRFKGVEDAERSLGKVTLHPRAAEGYRRIWLRRTNGMNIIVCGGPDASSKRVHQVLDNIHNGREIEMLICGASPGAEYAAFEWAMKNCVPACIYPINWDKLGTRAYEPRNQRMLDDHKIGALVAFPGPPRVEHIVKLAKSMGIQILDDME